MFDYGGKWCFFFCGLVWWWFFFGRYEEDWIIIKVISVCWFMSNYVWLVIVVY